MYYEELLNRRVVITLKTGIGITGIPTQWTDEYVRIEYSDNDNHTIIMRPFENIMMVSVFSDDVVVEDVPKYDRIVEPPDDALNHFEQDPKLRALKLADLHVAKTKAIKEQLQHHFKNSRVATQQAPIYDTPNLQK